MTAVQDWHVMPRFLLVGTSVHTLPTKGSMHCQHLMSGLVNVGSATLLFNAYEE